MPTILDTLKKGTDYLEKRGSDEARLNMERLVAHVLRCERMQLYLDFDRPLREPELETLRDLTKRRGQGEPLQHLVGSVEFCGLEFATDRRALIPRPETEELAAKLLAKVWAPDTRVLDLGCGSGVLGLALAAKLGLATTLSDISRDALDLARENAERLGTNGASLPPTTFVQGDLFEEAPGPWDLVVANLPYIPESEAPTLSREVLRDPAEALFGGPEGTEILLRFLAEAPERLAPGGTVAMEYGIGQSNTLRIAAEDAGLENVAIEKDLTGTERFLFATKAA